MYKDIEELWKETNTRGQQAMHVMYSFWEYSIKKIEIMWLYVK